MIVTIDEFRSIVTTTLSDSALQIILEGLESFVKAYTHNDFKDRTTGLESYPKDVKLGVINLAKWEVDGGREKAGIASETISRHSVSYIQASETNTSGGYPIGLVGFLKPYMRARF